MSYCEFIRSVQIRIANTSVGASTARGMGPGVVNATRSYLSKVDLSTMLLDSEDVFKNVLDTMTKELCSQFPYDSEQRIRWGSARKFINIFLRDVLYNIYLSKYYGFRKLESWLELPIDRHVAEGIRNDVNLQDCEKSNLPRWNGVIYLTPDENILYQDTASQLALKKNIARVHLDLFYWRSDRDNF